MAKLVLEALSLVSQGAHVCIRRHSADRSRFIAGVDSEADSNRNVPPPPCYLPAKNLAFLHAYASTQPTCYLPIVRELFMYAAHTPPS